VRSPGDIIWALLWALFQIFMSHVEGFGYLKYVGGSGVYGLMDAEVLDMLDDRVMQLRDPVIG